MSRTVKSLLLLCGLLALLPTMSLAEWDDEDWGKDWDKESPIRRPGIVLEGALPVARAGLDRSYGGDYGYGISLTLTRLDFEHWQPVKDRFRLRYTEDWFTLEDSIATSRGLDNSDKRARLWGITAGFGSDGKFVGNKNLVLSGYHNEFLGIYGFDVTPKAFSALDSSTASPLKDEDNQGQIGISYDLGIRFTTRHVGLHTGYEFVEVKRALVFWPALIHGMIQGVLTESLPDFLEKHAGHGWAVQLCSMAWRIGISAAAHHLQSYRTDWPYDRERPLLLQRWKAGLLFYL